MNNEYDDSMRGDRDPLHDDGPNYFLYGVLAVAIIVGLWVFLATVN